MRKYTNTQSMNADMTAISHDGGQCLQDQACLARLSDSHRYLLLVGIIYLVFRIDRTQTPG